MKRTTLTLFLIIIIFTGFARSAQNHEDVSRRKGYLSDSTSVHIPNTHEMLTEIINVIGLVPNFELKEANVQNVQASVSHRKRYILYNPEYISWINNATNDKWAAFALLAHEIGHHLNGHTIRKSGSRPALELEADEFAGFVLYKLGASLEQSQEVMNYIAKTTASKTHPARASRMHAIQNGWNKAAGNENIISTARQQ
jgi:Zn-dependent peptidase ImmA (M78 family)